MNHHGIPPCAEAPEDWGTDAFLGESLDEYNARIARVKAICMTECDMRAQCLALSGKEPGLVVGGLTGAERGVEPNGKGRPRGRAKATRCGKGHDLTQPEARDSRGACRDCGRERKARHTSRQKEAQAS